MTGHAAIAPCWSAFPQHRDDDENMEEQDYIRALHAINEFLPVKEWAGRPVEVSVLKEFGLIDSEYTDGLLAIAFGRGKERHVRPQTRTKKELIKEASQ